MNTSSREPILSTRNFDPGSRTLRKRNAGDDDVEDTVEKDVSGLAEAIVAQEEEARAQELVSPANTSVGTDTDAVTGSHKYSAETRKLGLEARDGQEDGEA